MKISSVLLGFLALSLALLSPVLSAEPTDRDAFYGFGPMEIIKLQWELHPPMVVDMNHDGLNDLVLLNNRKARIELLLQKKDFQPGQITAIDLENEDINDRFGKEKNWRFQRQSYPLDLAVSSLVVADLNRDGLEDLIYYTKEGLFLAYQEQANLSDEGKTELTLPRWLAPEKIEISDGLKTPKALAAGDLNNDDRIDLVLLRSNGVTIIWQEPNGRFARPMKFPSAARQLRQVTITDINGDDLNDLVIATSQQEYPIRIRLQDASAQLGPEQRYDLPTPSVVALARLDENKQNQFISVSRQSGRVLISSWTDQEKTEKFPVHFYPLEETESAKNRAIIAVDLDQDQLLDVIVSDPAQAQFLFYKSQAGLGLQSPQRYPGFKDIRKICVGHLADSSKPSLVVFSHKEELVGISQLTKGRITFPQTIDILGEPQAIELADINNDNRLDLVYISKKSKDSDDFFFGSILSLATNDQVPGEPLPLPQLQDSPLDMRVGDIDRDGRSDILILKSYGPLLLLRQKEPGIFQPQDQAGINSGLVNNVFPNTLSLVPINGQGKTVLLLAQKNFTRSLFFDDQKGWSVLDQYQSLKSNSHITAATAGHFESESALQIITYDNAHEQLAFLSQQDDGTYRTTEQINVGPVTAKRIVLGHFDSTQNKSLLLAGTNKLILVPVSRGAQTLREIASFEPQKKDSRYSALAVGDINNDQSPDILLCDRGRNHVEIITFDVKASLVSAYKFKVFETPQSGDASEGYGKKQAQPRSITIGDVTNDGLDDLILLVHDRIIIYPQDNGKKSAL